MDMMDVCRCKTSHIATRAPTIRIRDIQMSTGLADLALAGCNVDFSTTAAKTIAQQGEGKWTVDQITKIAAKGQAKPRAWVLTVGVGGCC